MTLVPTFSSLCGSHAISYILDADDRLAIANALNEVLHGPGAADDREFRARLGVSRVSALHAHRNISADGSA